MHLLIVSHSDSRIRLLEDGYLVEAEDNTFNPASETQNPTFQPLSPSPNPAPSRLSSPPENDIVPESDEPALSEANTEAVP